MYGGGFVMGDTTEENYLPGPLLDTKQVKKQSLFWLYGGSFVMGDATEENYLPGPLLDTKQVKNNHCSGCVWRKFRHGRRNRGELPAWATP